MAVVISLWRFGTISDVVIREGLRVGPLQCCLQRSSQTVDLHEQRSRVFGQMMLVHAVDKVLVV